MTQRNSDRKLIVVKRKTRLEELIVRYNTVQQAKFYIERLGADFEEYAAEDEQYRSSLKAAVQSLEAAGRVQVLDRSHVPNFIFGAEDTVVVVGQDGLVANTLKYLNAQPLIGVNPDPLRYEGALLPFTVKDLPVIVRDVLQERRTVREVTLAMARLNDGQVLYGVNDLFVGRRTHVSARYELKQADTGERQSSSGVIVSTGLGSTGWLRSVLAGAAGIVRGSQRLTAGGGSPEGRGAQHSSAAPGGFTLPWDAPELLYSVREPFPTQTTGASMVFGSVDARRPLRIVSQMPEDGVIFSDGVESDYLEFNAGVEAWIGPADKRGRLVV